MNQPVVPSPIRRQRLEVRGLVQGVGFRPHVSRLAQKHGLVGWVQNDSRGVTIEVQGPAASVDHFLEAVASPLPPMAKIDSLTVSQRPLLGEAAFVIVGSQATGAAHTTLAADQAVCAPCLSELNDPANRRYRYPFISCTDCGPRFTIVESLPYDRPRTTMHRFPMCDQCQREFDDPADRRFHAQASACPRCGPQVWFIPTAALGAFHCERPEPGHPCGEHALAVFHAAIAQGQIVAVKGIGGFHLACDATSASAVERLRQRKRRGDKPLAVMMPDLAACRRVACVGAEEAELLLSPQRPIVLLDKRIDRAAAELPQAIAPGASSLGLLLPYSPLHYLLVQPGRPLVMTSGNLADEPIAWRNDQAAERLAPIADAFLFHDRPIAAVCDDSVVRVVDGQPLPIRRSRGYAPLPVPWPWPQPAANILAVGAELKEVFCLAGADGAVLSQHIGDVENLETIEALERNVTRFTQLFDVEPEIIACDMHPGYVSSQWAQQYADQRRLPLVQVQHHHAHLAALACEHGLADGETLLGFCFDGTGYGSDGTIWGGELLRLDGDRFERLAHLKPLPLPGGDACTRKPYRTALAYLWAMGIAWDDDLPCVQAGDERRRKLLRQQLERSLHCPLTSSMGRLFDAVSSIAGICQTVTYEAQAAMALESFAAPVLERCFRSSTTTLPACDVTIQRMQESLPGERYCFDFDLDVGKGVGFERLLRSVCDDRRAGISAQEIAAKFHLATAHLIAELGTAMCRRQNVARLGLTGGVFQNAWLVRLARRWLVERGIDVLVHRQVPASDAGLALGQAWVVHQRRASRADRWSPFASRK